MYAVHVFATKDEFFIWDTAFTQIAFSYLDSIYWDQ